MNFTRIILLLALLLSQLTTNAQKIYYVDSAKGSDSNAGTNWTAAFRNVTKAMAVANSDTSAEVDIWIAKGTYTPIDGISSLPADHSDTSFTFFRGNGVGKALKIYGGFAGSETSILARDTNHITYLDGKLPGHANSYHVVTIAGLSLNADSVVLDGLTIRNGAATYDGGAFKSYNSIPLYRNWGGGLVLIYDNSAKLMINNCRIQSNTMNGGYGAGMYILQSNPNIANCYFDSNINTGYSGGAIYIVNSSSHIVNSKFIANLIKPVLGPGPLRGGAIANLYSQSKIENCIFKYNSIAANGVNQETYGGAIYNEGRSDTSLPAPEIDNCSFISNYSGNLGGNAYGAGVYNLYYSTVITNSTFKNNLVYSSNSFSGYGSCGGGIFNLYSSPVITNCIFASNVSRCYNISASASAAGGAIYNYYSPQSITNCIFTSDSTDSKTDIAYYSNSTGGAIFNSQSAVVVDKCTFNSNTANRDSISIGLGAGEAYGGAVYNTGSSTTHFRNCAFINNSALTAGGAIGADNGKETIESGNLFSNNKAMYGGAIWQENELIKCYGSVFVGNTATSAGGAFSLSANLDTLLNNVFIKNKASGIGGGALDLSSGTFYLINNTFYSDSAFAGGIGGAIHFLYAVNGSVIANNVFYKNYGAGTSIDTSLWPGVADTFANNIYSFTDPKFVNEADLKGPDSTWGTIDDGLELQACSPARNNGNNRFIVENETTDVTGAARIEGSSVDMGAYETTPIPEAQGPRDVCIGYTISLSDSIKSGIWISKNTSIATIDSTGLVKSIAIGTDTILYIVKGSCSTDTLYTTIRVNPTTTIGPITGITTICSGATTILSDSITGGNWTASNSNATVIDGIVTAIKSGADTITYTNGCHVASTSTVVTILSAPYAGTIMGLDTLCLGKSTLLVDTVAGGKWSTSNAFASISATGLVAAKSLGNDTIIYTVSGAICKSEVTKSIYIKDCRTFVKNISLANTEIEIYPNPNQGTFTINIVSEKDENIRVSITDITGKKVNEFNIVANKPATIKLDQPAGLYLLSAVTKNVRYNAKIIITQ